MIIFPLVIMGLLMMGGVVLNASHEENVTKSLSVHDIIKERDRLEVIARLALKDNTVITPQQRMVIASDLKNKQK